ncbi:MAG: hypothetical protein OXD54_13465 [Candidatus Poribacteria bacterium]|nr:hypothetical protein [Candidatus Poribacteria bacterium]
MPKQNFNEQLFVLLKPIPPNLFVCLTQAWYDNLLFEKDETEDCYVHKVRLRESKADLLLGDEDLDDNHDVSFHYTSYDFDSGPEQQFFKTILLTLNDSIADVEVFLFTGSLTDTKKTDFHFEYKGTDNNYHRYFPDFVIVKNTGNSTSLRLSLKVNAAPRMS